MYEQIFKAVKAKALTGAETKLSEGEYDDIFFGLCRDNNETFFQKDLEKFEAVPIRRWPAVLGDLKLGVHFQDIYSVEHYIKQFNAKNGEEIAVHDLRKENEGLAALLTESGKPPNNL